MPHINIFQSDAFESVQLTARWATRPYEPTRIQRMGLFETEGVRTTTFSVERVRDGLALLPYLERSSVPTAYDGELRDLYQFTAGHWEMSRLITPSEIQNARAFGEEGELEVAMQVIDAKIAAMRPYFTASLEYQRLCAIKGIILDSDGSTVRQNLYTFFGITQDEVDFDLDTAGTSVRTKCLQAIRHVEDGLGGYTYDRIVALCGSTFFENFIDHGDVKEAYQNWSTNEWMRNDPRFTGFPFAGITFEEYRGTVGGVSFIGASDCYIFPVGVRGMFLTRFAPADMMQYVNTEGLPLYVSQERLPHDKGIDARLESNPYSICTRPEAVVKGYTG